MGDLNVLYMYGNFIVSVSTNDSCGAIFQCMLALQHHRYHPTDGILWNGYRDVHANIVFQCNRSMYQQHNASAPILLEWLNTDTAALVCV